MKTLFREGLTALLALFIVIGIHGCATTNSTPPTKEAVVFQSFQSTWAIAHSAYQAFAELDVQGKVAKGDAQDIDEAWNKFRSVFRVALVAASADWSAQTPGSVEALKDDLITLIRSL